MADPLVNIECVGLERILCAFDWLVSFRVFPMQATFLDFNITVTKRFLFRSSGWHKVRNIFRSDPDFAGYTLYEFRIFKYFL